MKNVVLLLGLLTVMLAVRPVFAQQTGKWGDQGNGTYRNPILPSDYSDPDVIRVGSDYYLIASTMQLSPGIVILHSKDLVNWETLSYVVPDVSKLGPNFNWDKMKEYNQGIYAASIRYHQGKFYVHFTCINEGIFVCTATNPKGPWTLQHMVDKNGKPLDMGHWDDTCPLWDDDGKAYFVASKLSDGWYPHYFSMSDDGTTLLDADAEVLKKPGPQGAGDGTYPYRKRTAEGNKMYKINGFYYLFHNEVTQPEKYRIGMMRRSKYFYGQKPDGTPGTAADPGVYEVRKFLRGTTVTDREPNQGGLVETPEGNWYFITHQGHASPEGRTLCLLPVTWIDGWPVPGKADRDTVGTLIWAAPKPVQGYPVRFPQGSDEFSTAQLHPQWQWNYQPRAGKWSLTDRPGFLRLKAYQPIKPDSFFVAGNTIGQRYFKTDTATITIKIDISSMADGEEAGLSHFNGGVNHANIGIVQNGQVLKVKFVNDKEVAIGPQVPPGIKNVWLRSTINAHYQSRFAYSFDGKTFSDFGSTYLLKWGKYRGDYIGVYNYNNQADAGYIDIDYFHYDFNNR